jgi:heme O synthase-like polyprenyltransferase
LILGLDVLINAWKHHQGPDDGSARKLMFATIRYLPLLQLTYVIDHYLA